MPERPLAHPAHLHARPPLRSKRGFHVHLDGTFFLSSRAPLAAGGAARAARGAASADALPSNGSGGGGVLAVVEVVLVERGAGSVTSAEYSAAWCAMPLEALPGTGSSSGSGLGATPAGAAVAAAPGAAEATPRAGQRGQGPHGNAPAPGSPHSPLRAGVMAARLGAQSVLSVPLFVGSPRFLLLLHALPAAQCPPRHSCWQTAPSAGCAIG